VAVVVLEPFGEAVKDGLPVLVLDTLEDPDSVEDCLLLLLCNELPV